MTGASKKEMRNWLSSEDLADMFSVIEYWDEEQVFLFDDMTIGFMISMNPAPSRNSASMLSINNLFRAKMPQGAKVQWSFVSTPDIYSDCGIAQESKETKSIYRKERMLDKVLIENKSVAQNTLKPSGVTIPRNFEIWVSVRVPLASVIPSESEIQSINEIKRLYCSELSGFNPIVSDDVALKRKIMTFINLYSPCTQWKESIKPAVDELRTEIFPHDCYLYEKNKGVVFYSEKEQKEYQFGQSFTLKRSPSILQYGDISNLFADWISGSEQLRGHFISTLHVAYGDKEPVIERVKRKKPIIHNQVRNSMLHFLDRLRMNSHDHENIERELSQDSVQPVSYCFHLISVSQSKNEASIFKNELRQLSKRAGFLITRDNYFTVPFFLSAFPFGLDDEFIDASNRFSYTTTKSLLFLAPHIGSWKGNTIHPELMYITPVGQIVGITPFQDDEAIVVAGGKPQERSILLTDIISARVGYSGENDRVVLLTDRKVSKLINSLDKESSELILAQDRPFSLNPFSNHAKDNIEPILRTITALMRMRGPLSQKECEELKQNLTMLVNSSDLPISIDELLDTLAKNEQSTLSNKATMSVRFTSKGVEGFILDKEAPSEVLYSKLNVVDISNVLHKKGGHKLAAISLINKVCEEACVGDGKITLVIDLSFALFQPDNGLDEALSESLVEAKKAGVRIVLTTSVVNELISSDSGKAFMEEVGMRFLLKHSDFNIQKLLDERSYFDNHQLINLESIKGETLKESFGRNDSFEFVIANNGNSQKCLSVIGKVKKELLESCCIEVGEKIRANESSFDALGDQLGVTPVSLS